MEEEINYKKYCEELKKKDPRTMTYGELGDYRDLILSEAMEGEKEKNEEVFKALRIVRHALRILDLQLNLMHGKGEVNGFAIRAIANKFPKEQREEIAEDIGRMNKQKNKETLKEMEKIGGENETN